MKPSYTLFFILIFTMVISGCITPKEARQLKRNTEAWRESPVVLQGYLDSPLTANFLILRENKKFEYTSSGMFKTFEAGTWTNTRDTIHLYYVNSTMQHIMQTQKVFIDRKTSTLIFDNDTLPVPMRFRIVINEILPGGKN